MSIYHTSIVVELIEANRPKLGFKAICMFRSGDKNGSFTQITQHGKTKDLAQQAIIDLFLKITDSIHLVKEQL